jgi:hypothetical protein
MTWCLCHYPPVQATITYFVPVIIIRAKLFRDGCQLGITKPRFIGGGSTEPLLRPQQLVYWSPTWCDKWVACICGIYGLPCMHACMTVLLGAPATLPFYLLSIEIWDMLKQRSKGHMRIPQLRLSQVWFYDI